MPETAPDALPDVYTGDDVPAGQVRFEHYNARPQDHGGLLVCVSEAPQLRCTCGRYRLHWGQAARDIQRTGGSDG